MMYLNLLALSPTPRILFKIWELLFFKHMIMSYFVFGKGTKISSEVRWAHICRSRCGPLLYLPWHPVSLVGMHGRWSRSPGKGRSYHIWKCPMLLLSSATIIFNNTVLHPLCSQSIYCLSPSSVAEY